jgi:NitT/TauT family transport system ATP-binding protein
MTGHDIVLECQRVNHWFGPARVLHDINLRIVRGEIVSLVGPSGCGKSTLLCAILGTHPPRQGKVLLWHNGAVEPLEVRRPGRERGIVYQTYSLYPFLTARQNVAVGLMFDQTSIPFRLFQFPRWLKLRREHLREAAELLEKLRLGAAMNRYPHEMSGGMRQRVAIAQALVTKPDVLLLDEPFGALDEATREELQRMLLTLYAENRAALERGGKAPYTIIIVTHELNEAIYVGDRVVALSTFWNWREKGFETCPGATVVYDKPAPVYRPDELRDFEIFLEQREDIRTAAFNPTILQAPEEHVRFWDELRAGRGVGVLGVSPKI